MSEWTRAKVGLHWKSGEFSITTYVRVKDGIALEFPDSGYVLVRSFKEVGRF